MANGMAANGERVSDERAMATPGNGFSAHDGAEFCVSQFFEAREGRGEFGGLHVISETAETGIVPAGVDGIGAGVAKAAEFGEMRVGNVRAANGSSESVAIELRIVA